MSSKQKVKRPQPKKQVVSTKKQEQTKNQEQEQKTIKDEVEQENEKPETQEQQPEQDNQEKETIKEDPQPAESPVPQQDKQLYDKSIYQSSEKEKPVAEVNPQVRQSILFQKFCLQEEERKRQNLKNRRGRTNQKDEAILEPSQSENSENYDQYPVNTVTNKNSQQQDVKYLEEDNREQASFRGSRRDRSHESEQRFGRSFRQQSQSPDQSLSKSRSNSPPQKVQAQQQ